MKLDEDLIKKNASLNNTNLEEKIKIESAFRNVVKNKKSLWGTFFSKSPGEILKIILLFIGYSLIPGVMTFLTGSIFLVGAMSGFFSWDEFKDLFQKSFAFVILLFILGFVSILVSAVTAILLLIKNLSNLIKSYSEIYDKKVLNE